MSVSRRKKQERKPLGSVARAEATVTARLHAMPSQRPRSNLRNPHIRGFRIALCLLVTAPPLAESEEFFLPRPRPPNSENLLFCVHATDDNDAQSTEMKATWVARLAIPSCL